MNRFSCYNYFCWTVFTIILGVNCDSGINTVNLNTGWKATNANGSIVVPVTVPGTIYTDLEASGVLNDSYYRFNDINYRWVAYDNWTYVNSFQVPVDLLSKAFIYLVADGLDTVATVDLNGNRLAETNDMFVRYRWEIKRYLVDGNNTLIIAFTSPVTYALDRSEFYLSKYGYDVPPDCTASVQHGECHPNFIRKIQSQFSWDWGPAFPTMGIWQSIKLEALDSCLIRNVLLYPSKNGYNWNLGVGVYFDCSSFDSQTGSLIFELATTPPWTLEAEVSLEPDSAGSAFINITSTIPEDVNIEPWWPNGYGDQTLYPLNVTFVNDVGSETSTSSVRVGFRVIELNQDPINIGNDTVGNYFYFKINGIPVFLKGSNWIPADSFPPRVTEDTLRNLLQSAADAHMNSLRVWGGGQYEKDEFYDIADELGIMIWQDLMFACSMYPVDPDFLNSVTTEVTQQIRRLQRHPSILLWSGNNENEAALAQNWYGTNSQYNLYYGDYLKLYVNTTMVIAQSEDTSRPYITSSPTNGLESIQEGYVATNPQDTHYGDAHFYTYTLNGWNWKSYPRPRFTSEFGFQSWPSFETLSKVSIEEDWDWNSQFMESRQHHSMGNLEIAMGIQMNMNLPAGCTITSVTLYSSLVQSIIDYFRPETKYSMCSTLEGFKGMLYQSQIYQAVSIKTETEYYRRARNELINGEGLTMGTLYWQLDDIWQGASWSSIEYGGKWKILHYYATKFYAPNLISPYLSDDDTTVAYSISDENDAVSATLFIYVYKWNSLSPTYFSSVNFTSTPNSAVKIFETDTSQLLNFANCTDEQCFIYFTSTDTTGQEFSPPNYLFLTSFKDAVNLTKVNITVTSVSLLKKPGDQLTFEILLETNNIAPFVWLEAEGIRGRFSDNGFLMVTSVLTLEFYSWDVVTPTELESSLTVTSLMDLY